MRRTAFAVIVATFAVHTLSAQSAATLEQLLDRMGAYLEAYESQLSSVVADERFQQNVYGVNSASRKYGVLLESEVAFVRLPGGGEWLGFRDVRKVNSRSVKDGGPSIGEVLASAAGNFTKAHAIANASARHNLGLPRTVNVPAAALDIIHPLHRSAHAWELQGADGVRGTRASVIGFVETARPTLVREPDGTNLVSSGRVWVEPGDGRVWRVEWIYQPEHREAPPVQLRGNAAQRAVVRAPTPRLRVDFAPDQPLGMMVPRIMTEVFAVAGGRGEGRATYTNFRRFGTSARIVPQ
jgi:hypothetical protein